MLCKGEHQVQTPRLTWTSCPRTTAVNSSLKKGRLFLKTCQRAGTWERGDRPRRDRQHCGVRAYRDGVRAEHAGEQGQREPCGRRWGCWAGGDAAPTQGPPHTHTQDTAYSSVNTRAVHGSYSPRGWQHRGRATVQGLTSSALCGQWGLDAVPTGSWGKEELVAVTGGSLTRSGRHPDLAGPPPGWKGGQQEPLLRLGGQVEWPVPS